jgi:hypothetical protein
MPESSWFDTIELHKGPDLTAIGRTYRPQFVAFHGPGRDFVWPGRRVVDGDWPAASPEQCPNTTQRVWLNNRVLVCPQCGLDET